MLPVVILFLVMMLNKSLLRVVSVYARNLSTATSVAKQSNSDNRCAQLKQMLLSPKLEFIMEAHSALSAKIVEETGFKVKRSIFIQDKTFFP
mgnify:CR=1 FL=1